MPITIVDRAPTVGTSEYSVPGDTTSGVPTAQTDDCLLQVAVDWNAVAAGDSFALRVYEKATAAGTQRLVEEWVVVGPQSKPGQVTPGVVVCHGWDVTLKKLGGTDRSIPVSLRKVT
jgi:hypothetical protein